MAPFSYLPGLNYIAQVRGGGGATFGIVTSVVYKARPAMPIAVLVGEGNGAVLTPTQLANITAALAAVAPAVAELGAGGLLSSEVNSTFVTYVLPNGNLTDLGIG